MPTVANASLLLLTSGARRVVGRVCCDSALAGVTWVCPVPARRTVLTSAALSISLLWCCCPLTELHRGLPLYPSSLWFSAGPGRVPLFSLSVDEPLDAVALSGLPDHGADHHPALLRCWLAGQTRVFNSGGPLRRAEEATRQQAALLDLTHDTVFVRDTKDRILRSGTEADRSCMAGGPKEVAGRMAHELLRTDFPLPSSTSRPS